MSPSSGQKPSAADVFVYAPVGVASLARDFLPGFVAMAVSRGRSELESHQDRVEHEVNRARGIGQLAAAAAPGFVEKQLRIARERATGAIADLSEMRSGLTGKAGNTPAATAPAPDVSSNGGLAAVPDEPEERADLPIPDYDVLAASQVVDRLSGLGDDELRSIRDYESSHRGRKTVLGRIDQLTS